MEVTNIWKVMDTHLNCLRPKYGLGMKPQESWMELLKLKLPESEDIRCMSHSSTHTGVWTYPVIRQKKGKSEGERNCLPVTGAKFLQQIPQRPLKGVRTRVLWPTTLHQRQALAMAANGDVQGMTGHTTASSVSAIIHLMNPLSGIVMLA